MKQLIFFFIILSFFLFSCKKNINNIKIVEKSVKKEDMTLNNIFVLTELDRSNLVKLDSINELFEYFLKDNSDEVDNHFILEIAENENMNQKYLPITIFKFSNSIHPFDDSISFYVDSTSNKTKFIYNFGNAISIDSLKYKLIEDYYNLKNDSISDSRFKLFRINLLIDKKYNVDNLKVIVQASSEAFNKILDKESKNYFGKYFRYLNEKELEALKDNLLYFGFERMILMDYDIVNVSRIN